MIKMSISIADLDSVLNQFTMFLWGTFGELTFEVLLLNVFCLVEEIEVLIELKAVCEELDVLCDGVSILPFGLTVSRVGFSVFSIQVNIV